MWFTYLFAWPAELQALSLAEMPIFDRIAIQIRLQCYLPAERELCAAFAGRYTAHELSILLCLRTYLFLVRGDFAAAHLSLQCIEDYPAQSPISLFTSFLRIELSLASGNTDEVPSIHDSFWVMNQGWQPLAASFVAVARKIGDLVAAETYLSLIAEPSILEIVRQRAYILVLSRRFGEAIDLLSSAVTRFPQHLALQAQYVNVLLEGKSQTLILPALRQALSIHGECSELLGAVCAVKLLQRQPSLARRAGTVQRLWPSSASQDSARLSNLLVSYEQTGHAE